MTEHLSRLSAVYLPALETEMRSVLRADGSAADDPFYGMMHYHMGWANEQFEAVPGNSGKRIRPLLCLLACSAAGGDWSSALPAAAAIEILHNFSLVHDDIEDASPTRRGRATAWNLWGEPQAINTGDGMFALAHLAMARLAERGVDSAVVVRALRRFDETCVQLTQGQYADMSFETRPSVTVDEYVSMITGKTAVLVSLSAELGALIAGAGDARVDHFARFGLDLGLAFQMLDDLLGIWGDEGATGKSASTDLTTRKKTLPVLFGLAHSADLRALYGEQDSDEAFVRKAVRLLEAAGARDYTTGRATAHSDSALRHLEAARPEGDAAAALRELADMLLQRDH
jgi:geranylgeranyl diphosphate synthase type I